MGQTLNPMKNRILYFVSDGAKPEFPLSAAEKHFQVVAVPDDPENQNWFDWEKSGCLVCEPKSSNFISSVLQKIREQWISVPTVLFCATDLKAILDVQTSEFTAVLSADFDADSIFEKIGEVIKKDSQGDPSPLELRRRFAKLANQERRVLKLSLRGQTSKEIAEILDIRYQTVDKYKRNALHRMKARNIIVLMRELYRAMNWESRISPENDRLINRVNLG